MNTCCEQENYQIREEIAELRVRDSLTGLFNRKHFFRLTSAELQKSRQGIVSALLYVRPDRFSAIDERFGPLVSDALIKGLGQVIAESAGKHAKVSRFGGNIFTVLVLRQSMEEVTEMAEKIAGTIASSIFTAGEASTSMSASIGVVQITDTIGDTNQAFLMAQAAARVARERGGNCVEVNETSIPSQTKELAESGWERKISRALEADDFRLVYQPIASLMGTANNNFDVLVRMIDPDLGDVMPGDFMPAAERSNQMQDIDRWVISHALAMAGARSQQGKHSRLFLRISDTSLQDSRIEGWLREQFEQHQVAPDTVVFQITAGAAESNLLRAKALTATCTDLSCGVALAHFGVEHGHLQLMQLLNIDYVIIDGSFMQDLDNAAKRSQLEMIVADARERAIPSIATRVENAQELAVLCQMGIDYILGYHVQQPDEDIVEDVLLPS